MEVPRTRLQVRLLTPPTDIAWGNTYIAVALGVKGFYLVEPKKGKVEKTVDVPAYNLLWINDDLVVGSSSG